MASSAYPGVARAVTAAQIEAAANSFGLDPLPAGVYTLLADYLALLLRWNEKLNLTAIRGPESIVRRHFLESIFCSQRLPSGITTLLDFGSGAGFPGLPIALCRPNISVTLGESQAKKASFLREAVRSLRIKAEVFDGRIESMRGRSFDCVALRAVDKMPDACRVAFSLLEPGGWMTLFSTGNSLPQFIPHLDQIAWRPPVAMPGSEQEILIFGRRLA